MFWILGAQCLLQQDRDTPIKTVRRRITSLPVIGIMIPPPPVTVSSNIKNSTSRKDIALEINTAAVLYEYWYSLISLNDLIILHEKRNYA